MGPMCFYHFRDMFSSVASFPMIWIWYLYSCVCVWTGQWASKQGRVG